MEYLKYITPLITFLLGVLFTLYLKRKESRSSTLAVASKDLAKVATGWYNQWHDVIVDLQHESNINMKKLESSYIGSRKYLPEFIRTVETLRHFNEASNLVAFASEFQSILTHEFFTNGKYGINCRSVCNFSIDHNFYNKIRDLDGVLQELNKEAGRLAYIKP